MKKLFIIHLLLLYLMPLMGALSYAADGDECPSCHDEINSSYKNNIHSRLFTGCGACHGSSRDHVLSAERGGDRPVLVKNPFLPGPGSEAGNNDACLGCHDGGSVSQWRGSVHKLEGMTCILCHAIHNKGGPGPAKEDGNRALTEICTSCHFEIRARMQRSSHMPIRDGKMTCVDCHNPHGSMGPALLKEVSLNENCYRCHMEKRGPLIWEHAPVSENCATCHDPHGSNLGALLKMRLPYLCQGCHSMASHSSALYDGNDLAGLDKNMVGKGCLNCHPLVHGSNHPSGSAYSR